MKTKNHSRLRRWLVMLLALAVLLPLYPRAMVLPASAVTQAEIDALKNSSKDLANQRKEIQAQLAAAAADKDKLLAQKHLLEQEMQVIQSEINNLTAQINKYAELIAQKEVEIAEAQAEEQAQYALFCERVRYMEEQGQVNYWAILFNSQDFSDLLDRFTMVEEIMEYDNAVMNNLIAIRQRIQTDKAQLEDAKAQSETARLEQEAAKADLKTRDNQVSALIGEIRKKQDQLEQAEADLKAAAVTMDANITRLERELEALRAAQGRPIVSEKGFAWPISPNVSGYNTLTSLFGNRTHPVTGRANNHTGIDIAVAGGTSILAAKSGEVLTSGYNSSYGNYVVVSHGGGQSTLYAHMRSRAVSVGDNVKQGQVLGYVGTTGSSTGNHLHFEIRINGKRVDPIDYYSGPIYARANGQTKKIK